MPRWNAKVKGQSPESVLGQHPGPPTGQRPVQRDSRQQSSMGVTKELKEAMEGAQELMKAKRMDEAMKAYEAILEKYPEAALAYVGIGNIHASHGEYDDALEYYAGALHIRKDLLPALIMSGNVYVKQGLFDKALEKYKEALEINPGLGIAQLSVSRIYVKSGKFNEAIDCLNGALKHNPQLEEAHLALAGIYQRMGDTDTALKELVGVVSRRPDSSQAQFQYARLLVAREEFKPAIDACKKAIDLKPDSAFLHHLLGRSYRGTGEYELALREYTKALEINPDMQIAKIGIVRVNIERGSLADAKELLISMTKGVQHLGLTHRLLGEILMQEGAYPDAVAEFQAAILHSKRLVETHPDLLTIQSIDGNDRITAEAYERAFAQIDIDSMITLEGGSAVDSGNEEDHSGWRLG